MRDDRKVNEVLQFWFDGDQSTNYKEKWFPSSTPTNQGSTDSMQQKADNIIFSRFHTDLVGAIDGEYSNWVTWMDNSLSGEASDEDLFASVALIIILDQFSRHIYRRENLPPDSENRKVADAKAYDISFKLHQVSKAISDKALAFPLNYFIFSLMPYRHNPSVSNLSFVMERLNEKEKYDLEQSVPSKDLLAKFRKQTLRRLQHLQDRQTVHLFCCQYLKQRLPPLLS